MSFARKCIISMGVAAEVDPADVAQEVYLRAHGAKLRGEAKMSTWCYRVALNFLMDTKRKHARRSSLDQKLLEERSRSAEATDATAMAEATQAECTLQVEAFKRYLRNMKGYSRAEVAQVMDYVLCLAEGDTHEEAAAKDAHRYPNQKRLTPSRMKPILWRFRRYYAQIEQGP